MSGRCTLTATSTAVAKRGAMHLAERRRGDRRFLEDRNAFDRRAPSSSSTILCDVGERERLDAVLEPRSALAQHDAGTVQGFVGKVNNHAQSMGLACTRFSTPHGLEDKGNGSCVADLAALARAGLVTPDQQDRAARARDPEVPDQGRTAFSLQPQSPGAGGLQGITGLKTGYTDRADRSIVATARRRTTGSSASSCSTRTTRATRRSGCSTAASSTWPQNAPRIADSPTLLQKSGRGNSNLWRIRLMRRVLPVPAAGVRFYPMLIWGAAADTASI